MTQLTPLYDKSYVCIACQNAFSTKKVRSRFVKVTHYDTDFYPAYQSEEANPIYYYINVCPQCGFSYSDDTNSYFPPSSLETINEKISKQWVARHFDKNRTTDQAIITYKLAIYSAILKKEKHIHLAGLYLRVAWLYRFLANQNQESRFLKLALHEYLESYSCGDYQNSLVSEIKLLYLIAELSIRTNNYNQSVKYFSKVLENQKRSVEPRIIQMAKDRWYDIRESQKQA